MNQLDFIIEQTKWVDQWTLNQIKDLDAETWEVVPALKTSVNWQVGHIIISKYFHSMASVLPSNHEMLESIHHQIPLDDYYSYYFNKSNPLDEWNKRPDKHILFYLFESLSEWSIQVIEELDKNILSKPTQVKNPAAKTVYEALTFSFKHQMWHLGQLAMIKRILNDKEIED